MRDIAASEAAPSVTRVSDAPETAFSFATRKAPTPLDRSSPRRCSSFLERRRGLRPRADVPVVHRLRGHRRRTSPPQRKRGRADRRGARRAVHRRAARASCTTRRSSTPPTSATSCSTAARSPTCRRPRRRGARCRRVYDGASGRRRTAPSPSSACAATSCATCRTPTTRAPACTSPSPSRRRPRRDALEEYDARQGRDPAGVRRHRRDALAPPRGRHRARARGSSRTSPRPGVRDDRARCSTASTRARNLNPGKIV